MNRYGQLLIGSITLMTLAACSTPSMRKVEHDITDRRSEAHTTLGKQSEDAAHPYYNEVDEIYIGASVVAASKHAARPEELDQPVRFKKQYPVTLSMVAEYLATEYHLHASVTQDALSAAAESAYDPVQTMVARSNAQAGVPTLAPATTTANGGVNIAAGAFLISYDGTVAGLLDQVCARTGTGWRYENNAILIFGLDTKTFAIHAIPGATTMDNTITNQATSGGQSGGGAGGGGGGAGGAGGGATTQAGSGQNTKVAATVSVFPAVVETVKSMLTNKGKVAVNEATSSITVTDSPAALNRIETYIRSQNDQLTRQVLIDVRVYAVDINADENYGLNWDLVWENVGGLGASTKTFPDVVQGASQLALKVLDPTAAFGGSKVLLNALSKQGDVSTKTSATVVTTSNSPVPVQVTEETAYLAEVQTTLVQNAGAQTTLTPGKVTTGFAMTVLPVIMDDSEVLMQLQINLSSLRDIRQITSGQQTIESPQIDSQQFLQRVKLKSGSTLILSGFEQEALKSDMRGIGSAKFSLAGGSRGTNKRHAVLVVTLTPRVQE